MIVRTFIEGIFVVLVIPGVLLLLFSLSLILAGKAESDHPDRRVRRIMSLWLGIAVFALLVILNLFTDAFVPREPLHISEAPWGHVAVAVSAGAVLLAAIHELRKSSLMAILIAVLSAGSLTTLYFYIFIEKLREPVVIYAPSIVVGALAYVAFMPAPAKDLFEDLFDWRQERRS